MAGMYLSLDRLISPYIGNPAGATAVRTAVGLTGRPEWWCIPSSIISEFIIFFSFLVSRYFSSLSTEHNNSPSTKFPSPARTEQH